jgi:hypothetical protein
MPATDFCHLPLKRTIYQMLLQDGTGPVSYLCRLYHPHSRCRLEELVKHLGNPSLEKDLNDPLLFYLRKRLTEEEQELVRPEPSWIYVFGSSPEFVGKFLAFRPAISLQGKEGKYCLQRRGVTTPLVACSNHLRRTRHETSD